MTEKFIIYPTTDHDSKPYWDYLREHKAHMQKCEKCGRFWFPPLPSCPYCGALGGTWTPISGKGNLHSWVVVHRALAPGLDSEVPFIIALVDIEEGPRVIARLMSSDLEKAKIGMPLIARYNYIDDELTLLNFEPAI